MNMRDLGADANRALLLETVRRLGELADKFVFVGGCATGLLVTAVRSHAVRVTIDVDVVTQVATLGDYYTISAELEKKGFRQSRSEDAPLCRWIADGLQLDVVPTDPKILGFSNRWYSVAAETAQLFELNPQQRIRLITAPLFLATKLDAFSDRGRGDFWTSHDLEDFVTIVDGRPELEDELHAAPLAVRKHLSESIANLMANSGFVLALAGHLPTDAGSQARLPILRRRLLTIASMD
jgi:predicted nucleotidyltransferase